MQCDVPIGLAAQSAAQLLGPCRTACAMSDFKHSLTVCSFRLVSFAGGDQLGTQQEPWTPHQRWHHSASQHTCTATVFMFSQASSANGTQQYSGPVLKPAASHHQSLLSHSNAVSDTNVVACISRCRGTSQACAVLWTLYAETNSSVCAVQTAMFQMLHSSPTGDKYRVNGGCRLIV